MTKSDTCTHVRFSSILLVLLVLLSVVPFTASAAGTDTDSVTTYVITGDFEGKFDLSSENSKLFHLEDIAPGDKWNGKIQIKNDAPGHMAVCLLAITSDIPNLDLFNSLYLDISYEGKSIYSGSYNTGKTPITKSYIVEPKKSLTFDVEVSLPTYVGNVAAGKVMDSTWTFEGIYTEKPQTGANLLTENTLNLYVLWILFFAALGAIIISLRIRYAVKVKKAANAQDALPEQSKEVNKT